MRFDGRTDSAGPIPLQIAFNSVAYDAGLKDRDYIYEVNGVSVLEMDHDQCTKLIKDCGDGLNLKIER